MDQYSINSATIPSSSSSPPPQLPLFLDPFPFLSPSSLLPFDPSQQLLPPPPPPLAPPRSSKKRPRASRRAPTTVLTTDTSNFRAMVQEFTGIPSPPFSSSHLHFPSISSIRPFSHKHQTITKPNSLPLPLPLPLPPLSSPSNTFLQSLISTPPLFASSPTFPAAGREELQQSRQSGTTLDSWICSSGYK